MKNKAFKLGIIVGRFQTFHTGHKYMVDKACAVCDRVGILVGSSQESGTLKNPFTFEMRREMLKKVFGDRVRIEPLPDIGVGNNGKWGDYVLQNVQRYFGKAPDLLFFIDDDRGQWQRYTPSELWEDYEAMRAAVLAAKDNLFTESI